MFIHLLSTDKSTLEYGVLLIDTEVNVYVNYVKEFTCQLRWLKILIEAHSQTKLRASSSGLQYMYIYIHTTTDEVKVGVH